MPLIVILSVFPLAMTYQAWRFQYKHPPLSGTRWLLFGCGLLLSVVCAIAVACCWFNPFPLLADGRGGYSNIRNSMLFEAALSAALLTIGLAIFGRGAARLLLAGSGLLLAIMAFGAFLSNGV
jgi:hypothetical protein